MNENPLVTIGIPTYNRKDLLKRSLESALNQTYKNIDILVTDNHSEDGTKEMMEEYAKKYPNIRYFRQEENKGTGFQGKFLLDNSTGEYFCGLCDDDYISENYVEECVNILLNNQNIAFTYGTVYLIDKNNNIEKRCNTFKTIKNSFEKRIRDYINFGIPAFLASMFFRTDLYRIITSEYKNNRFCEDQLTVLKGLYFGKAICSDKAIFYKLNNGCTKDLETLKKTYNLPDMTNENYWKYLSSEYIKSILYDDFYKDMKMNDRMKALKASYEEIGYCFSGIHKPRPKNILKKIFRY